MGLCLVSVVHHFWRGPHRQKLGPHLTYLPKPNRPFGPFPIFGHRFVVAFQGKLTRDPGLQPPPQWGVCLRSWRGWTASSRHGHEQRMRQAWQEASPESRLRAASRIRFLGMRRENRKAKGRRKCFSASLRSVRFLSCVSSFFGWGGLVVCFSWRFPANRPQGIDGEQPRYFSTHFLLSPLRIFRMRLRWSFSYPKVWFPAIRFLRFFSPLLGLVVSTKPQNMFDF